MSLNEIAPELPLRERTLGNIAMTLPGATSVFRAAKLDYCCGGQITLSDAAATKSLDLDRLVADLQRLTPTAAPKVAEMDSRTLIETIVTRYHRVHAQELPELIRLAKRVEAVHRDNPETPAGLAALLEEIYGELTMHMQKEELILFPAMASGGRPGIENPIAAMMADHDDHGVHLASLKRLTNDINPPDEACTTWRALYAGLEKFADDLMDHIHIENNVLFPRYMDGRTQ